MVVNINNVILKFIDLGIYDNYQANINIYDDCNNLIYQGRTYNGELHISLETNRVYLLVAYYCNKRIITAFYVSEFENKYVLSFNKTAKNSRSITFLLKDANYNNLPIEKGRILFG